MTEATIRDRNAAVLYDPNLADGIDAHSFSAALWIQMGKAEPASAGRGTVLFVGETGLDWALRHYHRGGLIGRLLNDRYLWTGERHTRSFTEWRLLSHLFESGLPVPRPVGAHYRRHALAYTADLITERLHGSLPLSSWLAGKGVDLAAWQMVGRTVRRFHVAGVCHADLNAHNILLNADGVVHLVDFDRGRIREPGKWAEGNLARLQRSLRKISATMKNVELRRGYWEAFLDGYASQSTPSA